MQVPKQYNHFHAQHEQLQCLIGVDHFEKKTHIENKRERDDTNHMVGVNKKCIALDQSHKERERIHLDQSHELICEHGTGLRGCMDTRQVLLPHVKGGPHFASIYVYPVDYIIYNIVICSMSNLEEIMYHIDRAPRVCDASFKCTWKTWPVGTS